MPPPNESYGPLFEILWSYYPRKLAKKKTAELVKKLIEKGWTWEELTEATKAYDVATVDEPPKYIKHPTTFFGGNCWFEEFVPPAIRDPELFDQLATRDPMKVEPRQTPIACPRCKGSGWDPELEDDGVVRCTRCDGAQTIPAEEAPKCQ